MFQWWDGDDTSTATTVELTLEANEGGTTVQLREHGFPESPSGLRRLSGRASGLGEAVTLATFFIEHGIRY